MMLARFLVQFCALGLVVPLLIITSIGNCGLAESIAGPLAGAAVLTYLYGLYRWFKASADQLESPSARAWYRRKGTRRL